MCKSNNCKNINESDAKNNNKCFIFKYTCIVLSIFFLIIASSFVLLFLNRCKSDSNLLAIIICCTTIIVVAVICMSIVFCKSVQKCCEKSIDTTGILYNAYKKYNDDEKN